MMLAEFVSRVVQLNTVALSEYRFDGYDSGRLLSVFDMAQDFTTRLNYLRVAIFAASALVALSGSSVCHASCGEYVYSRFHTPANHGRGLNQRSDATELDVAKSEISRSGSNGAGSLDSTPALPTPCHGPNCSQNPTPMVPFAPAATVGSSNQDQLIFGHLTIELPLELSQRGDLQSDARARRGFPLLIEMPPEIVG